MNHESTITNHKLRVTGTVTAQLPSGLYQVDVEGSRITAHAGGGPVKNFIRVLIGDRVDAGRG